MATASPSPLDPRVTFPDLDDHLVREGTRAEILKGQLLMSPPADAPHATHHCDLAYVLRAHVLPAYTAALDMLTRTSRESDFAPDASVFPAAPDPVTGKRQLEELAFEVTSEQAIGVPSEKARELTARGVRRVFCVAVKQRRVLAWSRETDGWSPLLLDAELDDRCFAVPLPVRALLDAATADAAVVRALLARGQPELLAIEARGEAKGEAKGELRALRLAVVALCEVLGVELAAGRRAALEAMDAPAAQALVEHLKQKRRWPSEG